jgi:hypothetical protein
MGDADLDLRFPSAKYKTEPPAFTRVCLGAMLVASFAGVGVGIAYASELTRVQKESDNAILELGAPGYLWSGFGESRQCNAANYGHANAASSDYEVEANLVSYRVPGLTPNERTYTRSWVGASGTFCNGDDGQPYDGSTGPLGPCLQVDPGQYLTVRVKNNLNDGTSALRQQPEAALAGAGQYWDNNGGFGPGFGNGALDNITYPIAGGPTVQTGWFNRRPDTPEELDVINVQDLPGQDVSYDDVNLHFHGAQVKPHLFFPQARGRTPKPAPAAASSSDRRHHPPPTSHPPACPPSRSGHVDPRLAVDHDQAAEPGPRPPVLLLRTLLSARPPQGRGPQHSIA